MVGYRRCTLACALVLLSVRPVIAADESPATGPPDPAASTPTSKPPSSGDDFTGDKIVLRAATPGFRMLRDTAKKDGLALRGTIFRVTRDANVDPTHPMDELYVVIETVPCVIETANGKESRRDKIHIGVGAFVDCPETAADIERLVQAGEAYVVTKSSLKRYGFNRSGWTYGGMLVPYKYHFEDKTFSSATTIGPYLGYRLGGLFGIDAAFVTSIGLSSLTVANSDGNGTSTLQGFSFAIGVIGAVTKNNNPLQLGVVFGKDWAGSNSAVRYEHEGEWWGAAQIGFSFNN